jgi:hypothetical protein
VDDASFDVVFNQSRWIIVGSIVAFAIAKHVTRGEFDDRESLALIFVDGGVIRLELRRSALRVALTGGHSSVSALATNVEPPVPSIVLLTGGHSPSSSPTRRVGFDSTRAAPRRRC